MRIAASTLAGILVALASGLASAGGIDWVAKGTDAALLPAGRDASGMALHVCRADTGTGSMVLGKFWTTGEHAWECHAGNNGADQVFTGFDMLVEAGKADVSTKWVPGHATSFPQHSVVAAQLEQGGAHWLVCAALNLADGSMQPGYLFDDNCIYADGGRQAVAETYLVLASNDPEEATTNEAQPAMEGFDPAAILGVKAVADFCGTREGLCAPVLPDLPPAQ